MKIKSRKRRTFKIVIISMIALYFCGKWFFEKDSFYLYVGLFLLFMVIVQVAVYTQTCLELKDSSLKVTRNGFLTIVNESFEIDFNDIHSTYYKKEVYDKHELFHRFFWEVFFPSGQSYLQINLMNGTSKEIIFNGNEKELIALQEQLPDRAPN